MHLHLIIIQLWQFQVLRTVVPLQLRTEIIQIAEFLQRNMLFPQKLGIKFSGIPFIEVDQRRLPAVFYDLSQAAAGRLKNHISRAVSLLGQNNSGQTPAVPSLFSDLYQKYHPNAGIGLIQCIKIHLTVRSPWIFSVSFMEFQNRVRRDIILCQNPQNQRIYQLLAFFNGTAVYSQLRGQAVFINRIFICVKKLPHAFFYNYFTVRRIRYFYCRLFQETPHSLSQRIVVYHICNFRGCYKKPLPCRYLLRLFQIRRTGKTHHRVQRTIVRPAVNHRSQLNFLFHSMMDFIYKNRKRREFADQIPQFIGLPVSFIHIRI